MTTEKKKLKDVLLKDLLRHNSEHQDPWTAVFGKVYRLKDWRNRHPGGDFLIDLASGRDATILWQSYHPSGKIPTVKKWLAKLEVVGNLKYKSYEEYSKEREQAKGKQIVNAEALGRVGCDPGDKFWLKVNERVYQELKKHKIDWRWYTFIYNIEVLLTFIGWLFCLYFNFYSNCRNVLVLCFTTVLHGFLVGRMGMMMHTGNHGGASYLPFINKFHGWFASLVGVDHEDWIYWHQGSHHVAPNQLDIDANLTNNYAVNRLHRDLEWKPWHAYHVTIYNLLVFFGWIKWFTLDLYHAFKDDRKMLEFKPKKGLMYWSFKTWWIGVHLVLPRFITGEWGYLWPMSISYMISSYYLAMGFLVNHYHADLYDEKYTKPGIHWAVLNVVGSANWASGSVLQNWFWGGLNHQIEHHLFPSMNHMVYPYIAGAVKEVTEQFGYTYRNHEGFFAIWKSFYEYLGLMAIKPEWEQHS